MKKGLFSSAVWGVQWSTISMAATSIMQILYTSVMARLLEPEVFGIVAIAQIMIHFTSFFSRLGMGRALIQKEELTTEDIRAVFTSSFILGVSFCGLIWVFAPLITSFFEKSGEQLLSVIKIMSLTFLISGFAITSQSLIVRECKFKLLSQIEIGTFVVFMIVGIALAWLGFGVWSLVLATLIQSVVGTFVTFLFAKHSILPLFQWKYHKPFYSYGAVFSLTNIVDFIGQNIVQILIGRFYGDYKLGIYRQANNVVHLPLSKLSLSINNVFFPLLSKIQKEKARIKKSYLNAVETMSNLLFPVCLGISAASNEIVLVLLGKNFTESAPILMILCLGLGFQFLVPYSGVVLDATARLNRKLFAQLSYVIVLVVAVYLYKDHALTTLAWIVTISVVLRSIVYFLLVKNLLDVSVKEYNSAVFPGIYKGIFTFVIIYGLTFFMDKMELSLVVKFVFQLLTGATLMVYHLLVKPLPSFGRIWIGLVEKYPLIEAKFGFLLHFCNWYKRPNEVV